MLWLGGRMRAEGRLLVARALCVGHVTLLLRPLLRLGPLAAAPLFLWARGRPLPPLASFRFLYEQYAERDGFLHLLMSDLGDPLVEQRAPPPQSTEVASPTLTIAAAAASAAAATATARPPVVFWPPELARSYRGHLRYPSPPEPDEQVSSHAHTDLQRERSDMSEASMASGPSANSGVASALLEAWPVVAAAAAAAGLEEEARVALGLPEGGAAGSAGAVLGAGQESSTWQLFQRASSIAADGHHWRYDDDTTPRVIQNYIPTEESYVHAEMKTATRVPSWLRGFYKDTVPI